MLENINAVVIEDEQSYIATLEIMLKVNFPNIIIIGKASSVTDALALLDSKSPELVFMDINLPDGTAFDILNRLINKNFEIIFITSHSEFALKAFEFSAMHYLLKPITLSALQSAIERYFKVKNTENFKDKLNIMKDSFYKKNEKILIPTINGLKVYDISEIVRCEADNNYTIVYFANKQKMLVSKPLQKFDLLLNGMDFIRVHSKHLINLQYFAVIKNGVKPTLILTDNTELPISRSQKNNILDNIKNFAKSI